MRGDNFAAEFIDKGQDILYTLNIGLHFKYPQVSRTIFTSTNIMSESYALIENTKMLTSIGTSGPKSL